ncbi:MAG TPA: ABC transporter ATP-binding protein [Acidimicrobiales bacterium]|jgi:oligopeptide/dipeptide ABC transporter ATP-binding protein|nr:ABC transporter ATP-binding protein [Acidimicrobiales bacterium]
MTSPLLVVEDLTIAFEGDPRPVLDHVGLTIPAQGWMGLVGESGSGKTMTALALLGLLPPGARVISGRALMEGRDLLRLPPDELRRVRGSQIGMIFQSPRSALNPLMTVGAQIARAARRGGYERKPEQAALDLLRKVRMPDPEARAHAYPHQLSGGMCQRVLIAMMLAARPRLLIADEPTTGLDVTVQAEILELMQSLHRETGMTILLVSHDLGVIAENCQRVAVMYGGGVVEDAPTGELFRHPRHPYTAHLMATLMRADRPIDLALAVPGARAEEPPGAGCRYAGRCPHAEAACASVPVRLEPVGPDHGVACRRHAELAPLSLELKAGAPGREKVS